jgi:flagellar basal-body rod protein FlgF
MFRGVYAAGAGMIAQSKKIDVLGNNVANANTSGFKKDEVSFKTYNDQLLINPNNGTNIGAASSGVLNDGVNTDISGGGFNQTNLNTDIAITSDAFFAVSGSAAGGTEYTQNGNFTIDTQGYLSLTTGQRLMGQKGPILVGGDNFQVANDGTISQNGKVLDKIQLYQAPSAQNIIKQSDGLFTIVGATATAGTMKQGYLEDSNVDITGAMTQLMAATRSYQSCQESFKTMDDTTSQLNQIASLK